MKLLEEMTQADVSRHQDNLADMFISWLMANPESSEDRDEMYHTFWVSREIFKQSKTDHQNDPRFS